jgi:hypothetical protein
MSHVIRSDTGMIRKHLVVAAVLLSVIVCGPLQAAEEKASPYFRKVEEIAAKLYDEYEARFRRFIQVVEANLELRRSAKLLFKEMNRKLKSDEHLTATDQEALKRNFTRYRENREDLEEFLAFYDAYGDKAVTFIFPAEQSLQMPDETDARGQGDGTEIHISPHDDLGRVMILEIKMWLAAKLIVFDNYVVALARYRKQPDGRRQFDLETVDPRAEAFLKDVSDELVDVERFRRTLNTVKLVQQILEFEKINPESNLARDKDNSYLNTLIEGSYAYHRIPELTAVDREAFENAEMRDAFVEDVVGLTNRATYEVSELFGNVIGLYEERKGKLYRMPAEEQKKITDGLMLLDILFDKAPFRLTDRFIPGHWGHVGLWVGDSDDIPELRRLGVWEELPGIEAEARSKYGYSGPSFQESIEQDRGILEALRPGVELNTFADYLNIDDLAVIRDASLTDDKKKEYLLRAFAQIGKEYDFNFDVETHKRIVCSELAFVVFHDYDWPVERSVGRYTVSPDNVAVLALEEGDPFSPVLLYHEGKKLPAVSNRDNFKRLLEGEYDKIVF